MYHAPGPGAPKGLRHGPDGCGALPTEHLEPHGKIIHAVADVFEIPDAIVTATVALVPRTRRVPNYAVSRVYADRICILHQDRRAGSVVREEVVLAVEHDRRWAVWVQ
jgi:hypothetical protein